MVRKLLLQVKLRSARYIHYKQLRARALHGDDVFSEEGDEYLCPFSIVNRLTQAILGTSLRPRSFSNKAL